MFPCLSLIGAALSAMEKLTGVCKEDMIGKGDYAYAVPFYGEPRPVLIDLIGLDDNELINNLSYPRVKKQGDSLFTEFFNPRLFQGQGALLWALASPLWGSDGRIVGVIESIRDISEKEQIQKQLQYLTVHDSLTGLYNRTFFDQETNLLEKGYSDPVGVIVCDVDGLKQINDTFGHDAGDELLRAAATVIKNSFRKDDIVARIGGDEFVVLLPSSDHETVKDSYDRIKKGIALYNGANPKLPLSISVGFAIKDGANTSLNDTFKQADNNMYIEKRAKKRIVKGKFAL